MLRQTYISNYALIDSLEMEFAPGMTIITGETGAGKSILLGALSLLLGARADTKVVADPNLKSIVEATFEDIPSEVTRILEENDLTSADGALIVRREISAGGRSRAFVNDSPVNLSLLALITSRLVDIHSQHASLMISNPGLQLQIIDTWAGHDALLDEYSSLFHAYGKLHKRTLSLRSKIEATRTRSRAIAEQLEDLNTLKPRKGEQAELEHRVEILSDAGDMQENLGNAAAIAGGGEHSALGCVNELRALCSAINFNLLESPDANPDNALPHRIESLYIELKDIYETLADYASEYTSDPNALAKAEKRLHALYDANRRFRVSNADDLCDLQSSLAESLSGLDTDDAALKTLEGELRELGKQLRTTADILTESRKAAAASLAQKLVDTATPLGLHNLKFDTCFEKTKLGIHGQDRVEFMCAFNRNQPLMPMTSVASGGETSRMMLSLKSIMSTQANLPTIIFDEIDTGVSGEIADLMGGMMLAMGEKMQVMAITHLPQVAAKGDTHFKVYKSDSADKTITKVVRLDRDERINEIAGMLSGSTINQAALLNAKSLLDSK